MPEQINLIGTPFQFAASHDVAVLAKRVVRLEDMVPAGYEPLFNESRPVVHIVETLLANEDAGDYPAGCSGNVTMAVDPGGRYVAASGFPAVETCLPQLLKFIGAIEFYPGRSKIVTKACNRVAYRQGDRIVIAPEVWGGPHACNPFVFYAIGIEATEDLRLDVGTVFAQPLHGSDATPPAYVYRSRIPTIATGGTQVRVHMAARAHGMVLADAAIGVQASGPDMTATPVPLTFGGAASLTLPAFGGCWSDWVPLATAAGQSLLVDLRIAGPWGFKDGAPAESWYSAVNSHASATMLGSPAIQAARTHCIDAVQVK